MEDEKKAAGACPSCAAPEETDTACPACAAQDGSGTARQGAAAPGDADGCACRKKVRSEEEYRDLMNRLKRIEGQIRGIRRMVEESAYCPDILTQSAAANAALNSFNRVLLSSHIRSCVAEDIREGHDETVDELVRTMQKLMK